MVEPGWLGSPGHGGPKVPWPWSPQVGWVLLVMVGLVSPGHGGPKTFWGLLSVVDPGWLGSPGPGGPGVTWP